VVALQAHRQVGRPDHQDTRAPCAYALGALIFLPLFPGSELGNGITQYDSALAHFYASNFQLTVRLNGSGHRLLPDDSAPIKQQIMPKRCLRQNGLKLIRFCRVLEAVVLFG
jgi:hypothetical protein